MSLNLFSGGVFLTTGLAHMLPHIIEDAAEVGYGAHDFPVAYRYS
jgi:hypothetical protein